MIERLFNGFEGNLTSSKWAQLAKCSQDTALRDIDDLVARGILTKRAPRVVEVPAIRLRTSKHQKVIRTDAGFDATQEAESGKHNAN